VDWLYAIRASALRPEEVMSAARQHVRQQPATARSSQIVDTLNERFGLELTGADQLLFDQYEKDWLADKEVTDQARQNTIENFKLVFDRNFLKTVISRMDENDALFRRILDDPESQDAVKDFYGSKVYREARKRLVNPGQD
jgi:type I restriction enzyme R subunit